MLEDWNLNKIFRQLTAKGASYVDIFGEDSEVKNVV